MRTLLLSLVCIFSVSCTETGIYEDTGLSTFGLILAIGFIVFCFSMAFKIARRNKDQAILDKLREQEMDKIRQEATAMVASEDNRMYVAFYEGRDVLKLSNWDQEIRFENLLWVELKVNDNTVSRQLNAAAIERATDEGFSIRGLEDLDNTDRAIDFQRIDRIEINIGQKDYSNPIVSVLCYLRRSKIYEEPNVLNQALQFAQSATDMVGTLLVWLEEKEMGVLVAEENHTNVIDEVVRAKELMAQGVLTAEEFDAVKKRILE